MTGNPGIPMEVSLHALSDSLKRKTITLQGLLQGRTVSLLVDTWSSHTFISPALMEFCQFTPERTDPLVATIADGVISHAICRRVKWQIQKHEFQFDMRIMCIEGWDIILGVDFMYQYSPISFDFKQLRISLANDKETIMLQGGVDNPIIKLMSGKSVKKCRTEEAITKAVCNLSSETSTTGTLPVEFTELLSQFSDIFEAPTSLPPERHLEHAIPLKSEVQPFKIKPYRYPHLKKTEIENQVAEMLHNGIIQPSSSPFASPVLLVRKKDGTWRFCVDYRHLNAITIKEKYPIPRIEELLVELFGSRIYSKIDLRLGYHQVRVKPQDRHKTAFQTHQGHYEFLVMPFGLTNAPATFQSLTNSIFEPFLRKFVLVFFDDILVYSPTLEQHVVHLEAVLQTLQTHQLFAKRSKCSFAQPSVEYLGHVISGEGVSMDTAKVECIQSWPQPDNLK